VPRRKIGKKTWCVEEHERILLGKETYSFLRGTSRPVL